MPELPRRTDYADRIGDVFSVDLGDHGHLDLRLDDVEVSGAGVAGTHEPFSLLFRGGPDDHYLPQGTYDVSHPSMGTMAIFLVPLGPDQRGMRYEAVFG